MISNLIIFKLSFIYLSCCIFFSFIYINSELSGLLLIGFDFKSRIDVSDIINILSFTLLLLTSLYLGCILQKFLPVKDLPNSHFLNHTSNKLSFSLKFKQLSKTYVFFTILCFLLIFTCTYLANELNFTERTINTRVLKSKLTALLYPVFGYACALCIVNASNLSTRILFLSILLSSCIMVSYYEISRDYLLIISPILFFYRTLPFKYAIASLIALVFCICLDISYRTGISISTLDLNNSVYLLFNLLIDSVHYLTSFNVLNSIDQVYSTPDIPFTLKKLFYNLQPLPFSWITSDPYVQGVLHDTVRPRSLFSCLYEIHYSLIFLFIFFFGFLFEYSYRLFANYKPLVIVLCFICLLSFFQYYPRGSLRFLHLLIFFIFLNKLKVKKNIRYILIK